MRQAVNISAADVIPEPEAVLRGLSVPEGVAADLRFQRLLRAALDILTARSCPAGLFGEIAADEFGYVYGGSGSNDPDTPLHHIYPKATGLALFAVTLGREVSREIDYLFHVREFALATILDAAASQAAELAGDAVEREFAAVLAANGLFQGETRLLRYSPGYCGWHMSGQRALFDRLRPDEIGITLRESFLMEPLKSMSGVIAAGPAAIHDFEDVFPCCAGCENPTCRERIRRALSG
jgi:hypothetical protein